jgi:hypothetical protein
VDARDAGRHAMTGRDRALQARGTAAAATKAAAQQQLRDQCAVITAAAQARLAELTVPAGAKRSVRAEVRAARRAVWAARNAQIQQVMDAYRERWAQARAARAQASREAHARASAAHRARLRGDAHLRAAERAAIAAAEREDQPR